MASDSAFYLNDQDARRLRQMDREEKARGRNTHSLPSIPRKLMEGDDRPYIAVPFGTGGIPARVGNQPGVATCVVYKIIDRADSAGTSPNLDPILVEVSDTLLTVYNLSESIVGTDSYILVERDMFGHWIVPAGGGSGQADLTIRVVGFVGAQETYVNCGTAQHTAGTAGTDSCGFIFHLCFIQSWNSDCQRWEDAGASWVIENEGRRIPMGQHRHAKVVGVVPAPLNSIGLPVGTVKPNPDSAVLAVDLGDITRRIEVVSKIGTLCKVGTGTGTGIIGGTVTEDEQNLTIYEGLEFVWDPHLCSYTVVGSCLIAELHNCPLEIGKHYGGFYTCMVPTRLLPGTGQWRTEFSGCAPLFLHDREAIEGVAEILCVGNRLKVYKFDRCGRVVYSHDAGCCSCSGVGTGLGTGSVVRCWCDGKPTSATFTIGTFGLLPGTCLACSSFSASFIVTRVGSSCSWNSATLSDPCGGSLAATLVIGSGGEATLFIGGGAHDISAQYHLASGFNCNGSNTLTLVTNGAGCSNWPATITVAP